MDALVHAHSGLRWLLVIGILVSFVMALTQLSSSESKKGLGTVAKITFILSHVQLLIGGALLFMSPKVDFSMMKETIYRFFSVEHPFMMVAAIVLISLGYIKFKKSGFVNAKTIAIFFGIAIVLLAAGIPWPFRGLGSAWF